MGWIIPFFILFFPTLVLAADDSVRDEIQALQQRLTELERQVSKPPTVRGNEFNPSLTAFGDFVGRLDDRLVTNEDNRKISNRLNLREFEMDLRADVDPYAKAVVITSVEQEAAGAATRISIEEGYATLTRLPRGMSFKVGKFRTSFGTLNRMHSHDLPQTTLPLPNQKFLGEEGLTGMGVSINYIQPLRKPGESFNFTTEVFNGEEDTPILGGSTSRDPAYLLRGRYFMELSDESFIEIGSSALFGKNDVRGFQTTRLYGADVMYKWRALRAQRYWSVVAQTEVFYMDREEDGSVVQLRRRNAAGGYGLLQVQPAQRWFVGARYDVAHEPLEKVRVDRKIGGYITFYTTEFLRCRLGYEYNNRPGPAAGSTVGPDVSTIYGQLTFVFGSHPAEPYWFSK